MEDMILKGIHRFGVNELGAQFAVRALLGRGAQFFLGPLSGILQLIL
jgi:hypothetical protein